MVRITGNAEVRPVNVSQSLRQKSGESGKTSISTFLFIIIGEIAILRSILLII